MTNHDRFASVFRDREGRLFSTAEIENLMQDESDIEYGSILPNDHAESHKGQCWCVGTEHQIFERLGRGRYRVLRFHSRGPAPRATNVVKASAKKLMFADKGDGTYQPSKPRSRFKFPKTKQDTGWFRKARLPKDGFIRRLPGSFEGRRG